MKADEVLKLLAKLDQRLSIIWDQARATRKQAQNTVDRIDRLRLDIQRLHAGAVVCDKTSDCLPVVEPTPPAGVN